MHTTVPSAHHEFYTRVFRLRALRMQRTPTVLGKSIYSQIREWPNKQKNKHQNCEPPAVAKKPIFTA